MKPNYTILSLIFGIALFAMFFGAGNFVLPPFIGYNVGEYWLEAIIGFAISGILFPFLGILAVVKYGKNFSDLGERVNPLLTTVLSIIIILCIGPFVAIPRTGAIVYESAIKPIYEPSTPIWTSIIYFTFVFIFSLSPRKLVDILGKFITPILLILLIILIVLGFVNSDEVSATTLNSSLDAINYSFNEGYQTMDVLASVFFAGILINAARNKGYVSVKEKNKIVVGAASVSLVLLLVVYGSLIYLGAHLNGLSSDVTSNDVLMHIANNALGENGIYLFSLAMLLACLTTSVALTAAFAYFFARLTNDRMGYYEGVIICTIISIVLSISSFDEIISYTSNLLMFIYPIIIVMILFVLLFGDFIDSRKPYLYTVLVTAIVSFIVVLSNSNYQGSQLKELVSYMPLKNQNLEWLLPAIIVFVLTSFFYRKR